MKVHVSSCLEYKIQIEFANRHGSAAFTSDVRVVVVVGGGGGLAVVVRQKSHLEVEDKGKDKGRSRLTPALKQCL